MGDGCGLTGGGATDRVESSAPIAHRREDGATHDLAEHLTSTGALAARFAADWGAYEAGRIAGCWHDLGKYAERFQSMIRGADRDAHLEGVPAPRQRIDHSTAGAIWAVRRFGQSYGRLLAYCIAGHHAGLSDWVGEGSAHGVKDRLRNEEHLRVALAANPPRQILELPDPTQPLPDGADFGLWTRMLASALFDADFLDSEGFFDPSKSSARQVWPSLNALGPKLDARLAQIAASATPSPVNRLRENVLRACRNAAGEPPGLFSLTVPTGGGKTLSSLAFALGHAARHGLRRVVYAIPFTSIIEQTAGVFREALGDDAVLEHHSALGPRPEYESARSRLASENWDAPLVVTTTVQLFESLFASRTSQIRKLHNLARSVLILDEAQALPAAVLRPIVAALDQLCRQYGTTVVLCTATQPALHAVFKELPPRREIIPDPPALFAALDRVTVSIAARGEQQSWEEIADRIAAEPQALAIVNTRADCRALHALLPAGAVHLSTWQCAAHRRTLFAELRRRLHAKERLHVVSTSLVEAGVDIDFPAVFRVMAGLDSLAQAAGRCNRNGTLDKGRFVVFRPHAPTPRGHIAQAVAAAEAALRTIEKPFALAAFDAFFHELYWLKGESLDAYGMNELLGLGPGRREGDALDFRYRTAAERFRMIDDTQETIVIPYGADARDAISALRRDGPSRALLRRLQPYTVPVQRDAMQKLHEALAAEALDGATVLTDEALYDREVGLRAEELAGPSVDDFII